MKAPILILYNIPQARGTGMYGSSESDAGVLVEIQVVSAALDKLSIPYRSAGISRLEDLPGILTAGPEAIIFNLVEELPGPEGSSNLVPAVCKSFGKTVTGCDTPCMALTLDKWRMKAVLKADGVPVPEGVIVPVGTLFSPDKVFPGPYIVKPCSKDASEGIGPGSVVPECGTKLHDAVRMIHTNFKQPALVEQYVGNREFNISLLQQGNRVRVLPIAEIDFSTFKPGMPLIVDYTAKWLPDTFEYKNTSRVIPVKTREDLAARIREISLRAWHAVGCGDYARVDMRMDESGRLFVLEVNANPDISPDGGFPAAISAAGISFEKFIETVLANASGRLELSAGTAAKKPRAAHDRNREVSIRMARPSDRDTILIFTDATRFFRAGEVEIAREVLDDSLAQGPDNSYRSFVAELKGKTLGWVCFGPTPCTVGTYDIYWLVVDADYHGKGIGTSLMEHAEKLIGKEGGRLAVVETSSQERYKPTRSFYTMIGYTECSRVKDFYDTGDDKVIYVKRLA